MGDFQLEGVPFHQIGDHTYYAVYPGFGAIVIVKDSFLKGSISGPDKTIAACYAIRVLETVFNLKKSISKEELDNSDVWKHFKSYKVENFSSGAQALKFEEPKPDWEVPCWAVMFRA